MSLVLEGEPLHGLLGGRHPPLLHRGLRVLVGRQVGPAELPAAARHLASGVR